VDLTPAVGGSIRLLSDRDVRDVDAAARSILAKTGVRAEDERLVEILVGAGGRADTDGRVTFPPHVVDDALESAPSRVLLHGRSGYPPLDLGGRRVYLGTGGAAIRILDLDDGRAREPRLSDLADIAWLVEQLEHVHFFLRPVVARDVPPAALDLCKFYTCLVNTRKHVMGSAGTPEAAKDVIDLAAIVAGGEEALTASPIVSFVASWMVSPLKLDVGACRVLAAVVERGVPVALSSAPVAGSTAPATLAGLLAQVHAEQLSGIVLAQAIRKGAPVLYGPVPAVADFHTMGYAGGAIESCLLNAACAQLAHSIEVPVYSDAGLTDSKLPDVQAGYEKGMNVLLIALAGGNYIHHSAGMLESMLTVAYEQYVIDNDINGMALRALRGIEVSPETLAEEVVASVGPGGHYLTHAHTLAHVRSNEYFVPATADRRSRSAWEAGGSRDARERAREIARSILAQPRERFVSPEVDRRIRNRFDLRSCAL
jgi:trimethylamine--corrinoid protein Co-methyltransferase